MQKSKDAFKMLKMGWLCYPVKDIDKEFIVKDTFDIDIRITKKEALSLKDFKGYKAIYAYQKVTRSLWSKIKKENLIQGDWLVPHIITVNYIGAKKMYCVRFMIDVLEEVK